MDTKLIQLKDGTYVEVQVQDGDKNLNAGGRKWEKSFEQIEPILERVSNSVAGLFDKVNENIEIEKAEVDINLGFQGQGNVFVAKGKLGANLTVKLFINRKNHQQDK